MVLEDIFDVKSVKRRPYLALIFGFFFTFLAFFVSAIFFKDSRSVAMVFLTTLMLVPVFTVLIKMEEKAEGEYGLKHFFRNHKDIFEIYLFSFIGVFAAFVVLGLGMYSGAGTYNQLFNFQTDYLKFQQGLTVESVNNFVNGAQLGIEHAASLFAHNLLIVMICFVLSFFYGATAIFLIILNGSVFANFIVFVIKTITENAAQGIQAFFFFLIHLVPEVSGFLVAAIAGGVVSKAMMQEKKGSKQFKNVFKDATVLVLIAIGLVLLGVVLEVFVTARLFQAFF